MFTYLEFRIREQADNRPLCLQLSRANANSALKATGTTVTNSSAIALAVAPEPWLSDDHHAQQCSMVSALLGLPNAFGYG